MRELKYTQKASAEARKEMTAILNNYEIIDWEAKGNLVRFYLGKNGEQWGDDWDDAPWQSNAGTVYTKSVQAYADVAFPFSSEVYEAGDDSGQNKEYSKEQMIKKEVPCIIVLSQSDEAYGNDRIYVPYPEFENLLSREDDGRAWKIFFGEKLTRKKLKASGAQIIRICVDE